MHLGRFVGIPEVRQALHHVDHAGRAPGRQDKVLVDVGFVDHLEPVPYVRLETVQEIEPGLLEVDGMVPNELGVVRIDSCHGASFYSG